MAKFMLILRDNPRQYDDLSPAEMQAVIQRYSDWSVKIGERHAGGQKLGDERGAAVMRRDGDRTVVTDGPFGETKEMIGGFFMIEADDLQQAIELCRDHPQLADNGSVEIRQVDDLASCGQEQAAASEAGSNA